MPQSELPYLAAVITAFSVFIVVVGGVSIWTCLPTRDDGDQKRGDE